MLFRSAAKRELSGVLLRAMLQDSTLMEVVVMRSRGLVDFRVQHVFSNLLDGIRKGRPPWELGSGDDMERWIDGETEDRKYRCDFPTPGESVEAALDALERISYSERLEVLSEKAKVALAVGRQDEYLDLLAQQQALRRKLKTITY